MKSIFNPLGEGSSGLNIGACVIAGNCSLQFVYTGGDPRGGGGGIDAFKNAANNLAKKKFKPKCLADFGKLGVTGDQVHQAAAAANFLNGIGSTVSLASLYQSSPVPSVRQAGRSATGTVGSFFANNPGTVALSQLGGNDIYLNPGLIDPSNYYQTLGTVLHEVLHNVSGLTDQGVGGLQDLLGLKQQDVTDNVTQKLIKDCF